MSMASSPADIYAKAYAAHYTTKNYQRAAFGYAEIIQEHPRAPEAAHARAQILNLLAALVPIDQVLASHLSLILSEIETRQRSEAR